MVCWEFQRRSYSQISEDLRQTSLDRSCLVDFENSNEIHGCCDYKWTIDFDFLRYWSWRLNSLGLNNRTTAYCLLSVQATYHKRPLCSHRFLTTRRYTKLRLSLPLRLIAFSLPVLKGSNEADAIWLTHRCTVNEYLQQGPVTCSVKCCLLYTSELPTSTLCRSRWSPYH